VSHNLKEKTSLIFSKQKLVGHYWWVFVFIVICFGIYAHASNKKQKAILALESHLQQLSEERQQLLQENEELQLNINSQSDPAWVELTLMKGLGLVPEGQVKVYFDMLSDK